MNNAGPTTRVAIDIGGTFTDVVLDRAGRQFTTKVLTTVEDPAAGVMAGLDQVMRVAGAAAAEVGLIIHGTTLATNALIERRGARTALITTAGHRDALEMAFENRFEQYDVNIDRPLPLVPRELRFTVPERMNAKGEVLRPLDETAARALCGPLLEHGIESVAVGLLHAYANGAHEARIAEILEAELPDLSVTLGSLVCPEIREYERLSTACANAFVKPLMGRYLRSLAALLGGRGFACPFLLMTSGGGLTTLETATEFPVRLVESGPAGGAILAAHLASAMGINRVVSFDMGGTTAKICLIDDGEPLLSRSFEVDRSYRFKKGSGLPVRIPVIEMVEIGAGGGSIAEVDTLDRIQVGPASAGSQPGPAAYGRGGERATVTDADVVLGRIDAASFAGGNLSLDVEAASNAVAGSVSKPLGIDVATGAYGISEIVDENMSSAARAHALEWGKEAAGRTMVAFGGAAPLHAARLALKLGIDRVLIPRDAGVGSAIGFLLAPVAYEVVRSRHMLISRFDPGLINQVMTQMSDEARAVITPAVGQDVVLQETRRAHMRYVGQGYEIAVPLPARDVAAGDRGGVIEAFENTYQSLYGRLIPNLDVEVLSWTLTVSAPVYTAPPDRGGTPPQSAASHATGRLFDTDGFVDAPQYRRETLATGIPIAGPALIIEDQTTSVILSGFTASVNGRGDLELIFHG